MDGTNLLSISLYTIHFGIETWRKVQVSETKNKCVYKPIITRFHVYRLHLSNLERLSLIHMPGLLLYNNDWCILSARPIWRRWCEHDWLQTTVWRFIDFESPISRLVSTTDDVMRLHGTEWRCYETTWHLMTVLWGYKALNDGVMRLHSTEWRCYEATWHWMTVLWGHMALNDGVMRLHGTEWRCYEATRHWMTVLWGYMALDDGVMRLHGTEWRCYEATWHWMTVLWGYMALNDGVMRLHGTEWRCYEATWHWMLTGDIRGNRISLYAIYMMCLHLCGTVPVCR